MMTKTSFLYNNPSLLTAIKKVKRFPDPPAGLGGRGRSFPTLQGFDPLPTQRVAPLNYFELSIFVLVTLKFFLKAPLAPNVLILRGSACQKTQFFGQKFQKKCLKTPFSKTVFKNLPMAQKI